VARPRHPGLQSRGGQTRVRMLPIRPESAPEPGRFRAGTSSPRRSFLRGIEHHRSLPRLPFDLCRQTVITIRTMIASSGIRHCSRDVHQASPWLRGAPRMHGPIVRMSDVPVVDCAPAARLPTRGPARGMMGRSRDTDDAIWKWRAGHLRPGGCARPTTRGLNVQYRLRQGKARE
jgi:hypothetical protein